MALGKGADALLRNINGTNTAIDEAVDKNIEDNTSKKNWRIDGKDFISRAK